MINPNIFEISSDDIAHLSDADLRDLIGMLCEADYRSAGLGVSGIRYGGHQDAKDGGIDVMIENDFVPPENSFVPRKITAFQVKKPNMFPSEVISEMKPGGKLRPKIRNLIKQEGAYVIVSSGSSVSDTAYDDRINAMKEAVANENNHENLHVDFFDQKRISTWVRSYPSMILWVRKRIGREISGWQPYGNWSKAPGGLEEQYILDETLRLFDSTNPKGGELTAEEGLTSLRQELSKPRTCIRLTGLSGVGKTRLVQALFDDRIGQDVINPSLAIYTDNSDSPQPDPRTFAEQLSLAYDRVILIVDNCPPELHRKLTEVCTTSHSKISLLTVEYDVKDDIPEETHVFRLQEASCGVVMKIISTRYPYISQVDANALANFSGGNARVAIALANTIKSRDNLSSLRDEHLFERLFWQRNKRDKTLLHAAEVFSLLYSFDGTDTSPKSELSILGSLIGNSANELFRHISDLKERGLLQARSNWRAVLPHAIANRLAKKALEVIPKVKLVSTITRSGNERMIKSFTHRLSYLHDSEIAEEIASDWLLMDGWIGEKIFDLNDIKMQVLQNLAPVCPDQTLDLLEKAARDQTRGKWFTSRDNPKFLQFVKLLRHLAYEAKTFQRSATLMAKFAASEVEEENINPIRDYFKALFFRSLSGTLAPPEDKVHFIEELLSSDDTKVQNVGVLALEGSMKVHRFFPPPEHSFGARRRDYGYKLSKEEVLPWYETIVKLCTSHILSGKPTAKKAKILLAEKLRELWVNLKAYDLIEACVNEIRKVQNWNEAWILSSEMIQFDFKKMPKDALKKLLAIRKVLKPQNLENLARSYALSGKHLFWDLEQDFSGELQDSRDSLKRLQEITIQIGSMVAKDEKVLDKLLPELVSTNNSQLHDFGKGIAKGCTDKRNLWAKVKSEFINTPEERRYVILIQGFLYQCKSDTPDIYCEILDEILDDEILGMIYPLFESSAPIDIHGLDRLYKSLEINRCNIDMYSHVVYNGAHVGIGDDDLANLLEEILKKENGFIPVTQILTIRFTNKKDPSLHSDKLLSVARKTLTVHDYSGKGKQEMLDHALTSIAEVCLGAGNHEHIIKNICMNIRHAFSRNYMSCFTIEGFMGLLLQNHPEIFLESFLDNSENSDINYFLNFHSMFDEEVNPLNKVSDEILIKWCENDPENRFTLLSGIIQPFVKSEDSSSLTWREVVYYIFENVQELEQIFENIAASIRPNSHSGSFANLLQTRISLFDELEDHSNDKVRSWAKDENLSLQREIRDWKEFENSFDRDTYESFE